jgi:hypothetical protein
MQSDPGQMGISEGEYPIILTGLLWTEGVILA